MVDGHQPVGMQAFHLHAVVHNIAKTIERATVGKFLFRLANGSGDTEAETAPAVYLYRRRRIATGMGMLCHLFSVVSIHHSFLK